MGEGNENVIRERDLWRQRYLWETRRKPQIKSLLKVDHGQYMAIESVCHSCEHVYKTIHSEQKNKRSVMQEALESVIRLYDHHCGSCTKSYKKPMPGEDNGTFTVTEDIMDEHHGRQLAFYIREFLRNQSSHEGWLETTTDNVSVKVLFNDENDFTRATFASSTYVDSSQQTGEINIFIKASRVIRALIRGIDLAYETYLDSTHSSYYRHKYSPATCGCSFKMLQNAFDLFEFDVEKDTRRKSRNCVQLSASSDVRVISIYSGLSRSEEKD